MNEDEPPLRPSPENIKIPEDVHVYEVNGPFLFGALHKYEETMRAVAERPRMRIIILRKVNFLDPSDLFLLEAFYKKCHKDKIKLVLLGLQSQPLRMIKQSGLYDSIGPPNFVKTIKEALKRLP